MLYEKSKKQHLDDELFKNPTCEYRGAPFWAWNCKLEKDELLWQIENFKKMGFGGFHMHVRAGMATNYLSDEYMDLIKACVDKAKELDMKAYLYDEDRWPSGFAGGLVTKNYKYRQRYIVLTSKKIENAGTLKDAETNGKPTFLASYDILLNEAGEMVSYKRIGEDEPAQNLKRYVYLKTQENHDRYNKQTYVDVFSKEAINEFVSITHERFKEVVGEEFDATVPSIFTDEPQFFMSGVLDTPFSDRDVGIAWSLDFTEDFKNQKGYDILDKLPEVFWKLAGDNVSRARYDYHDYRAERFRTGFNETIGDWCKNNNIALTGHLMQEPTLWSQTHSVGECMRNYKHYGIPGIDTLHDCHEFTTAKQVQSIVHQYGKQGMMSELYGVTNWDFDFRDHKHHGDWQMALGVTLLVPHLSWVSMKGGAKRDYPASINYQIPWWKEYGIIQDHFARVGSALTRGKPVVKVAVVHPIETYWLNLTTNNDLKKDLLEKRFASLTEWLLFNCIDFDFISEADILGQKVEAGKQLKVGEMSYDAVILPALETIRENTFNHLNQFAKSGGKLVILNSAPTMIDLNKSEKLSELEKLSTVIPYEEYCVAEALKEFKHVTVTCDDGKHSHDVIYQYRNDNDCDWLFLARGKKYNDSKDYVDIPYERAIKVTVKGEFTPKLYDTMSGEIKVIPFEYVNGATVFSQMAYRNDSFLFKLCKKSDPVPQSNVKEEYVDRFRYFDVVDYRREEDNAVILDECEYRFDDGKWQEREYVLRATDLAKLHFKYPSSACQPWVSPAEKPNHTMSVRYYFYTESTVTGAVLATEDADISEIYLNGKKLNKISDGWWTDKSITRLKLPKLKKGENVLEITMPFGARDFMEPVYILGDFGVKVQGVKSTIVKKNAKLGFGDIVPQGMPFYSGNLYYDTKFVAENDGDYNIIVNSYRGAFVKVFVDGEDVGNIVLPPYLLKVKLTKGEHKITYLVYGNRHNAFGPIHKVNEANNYIGPGSYGCLYERENFTFEYRLKPTGILASPIIERVVYKNTDTEDKSINFFIP